MAEPEVSIRDLTYRYRGKKEPALDGVNLEVAEEFERRGWRMSAERYKELVEAIEQAIDAQADESET